MVRAVAAFAFAIVAVVVGGTKPQNSITNQINGVSGESQIDDVVATNCVDAEEAGGELLSVNLVGTGIASELAIEPIAVDLATDDVSNQLALVGVAMPTNLMVTDLTFWGVARSGDVMRAGLAWPVGMTFTNDVVDVYGATAVEARDWRLLYPLDIGSARSNAVTEVALYDLACRFPEIAADENAVNAVPDKFFLRAADSADSDEDGIKDADERWNYGSDPFSADGDGDGIPDVVEDLQGLDPSVSYTQVTTNDYGNEIYRVFPAIGSVTNALNGKMLFEKTFTVDRATAWRQIFLSSAFASGSGWNWSGTTISYETSSGESGTIPNFSDRAFRIPLTNDVCGTMTLQIVANGGSQSAVIGEELSLMIYEPELSLPGCAVEEKEDGTKIYVTAEKRGIAVEVNRSGRPPAGAIGESEFCGDPFGSGDDHKYDATNATVAVAGAGEYGLPHGNSLLVIDPELSFGAGHDFTGARTLFTEDFEGNMSPVGVEYEYPLDSECLWKGWIEGTNETDSSVCDCVPALFPGYDESKYGFLTNVLERIGDAAVGKVFLGSVPVWSNMTAHARYSEYGGTARHLSAEGCGCGGGCEDGDCDDLDGPSLGSLRFRLALGRPNSGQVSGFLYFKRDAVFTPDVSSFDLKTRNDAAVVDVMSNGVRRIVCHDNRGRTITVSNIVNGVGISIDRTTDGVHDRGWELTREGNSVRFRKFSAGGNQMQDVAYAEEGGIWSATDAVSGLVETKFTTGDLASSSGLWEDVVLSCGGVTGSHVRVKSEFIGDGANALVRETERREKGAADVWKRAYAEYWDDPSVPKRHGSLRLESGDDRSWTYHDYDDEGREIFRMEQMNGSAAPYGWGYDLAYLPENTDCFVTIYDYVPFGDDSADTNDVRKIRTEELYAVQNGSLIEIGKSWRKYVRATRSGLPVVTETVVRAGTQNAALGDAGNAVSTRTRYSGDSARVPYLLRGMTVESVDESGVKLNYDHETVDGVLRTVVRRTKGTEEAKTRTVTERDLRYGSVLYEATQLSASPNVEFGWRRHRYDEKNRLVSTVYDDGSIETNEYSCCRELSHTDRSGAKILYSATTGTENLYRAEEDVYLRQLPPGGDYRYGSGLGNYVLNASRTAFRVHRHYFDAFGRETNTITQVSTVPGAMTNSTYAGRTENAYWSSSTVRYADGFSDRCETVDEKGLRTLTVNSSDQEAETTTANEYAEGEVSPSRTVIEKSVRGGGSESVTMTVGAAVTNATFSVYAADGERSEYSVRTASDRDGTVTNSVSTFDFLGRLRSMTTGESSSEFSYDGCGANAVAVHDAVSGLTVTNLYDATGLNVGTVCAGVVNECDEDYEGDSGVWWRKMSRTERAGDVTNRFTMTKERLTGLSSALSSEREEYVNGALTGWSRTSFDDSTLDETVESWTFDGGRRTSRRRFGVTWWENGSDGEARHFQDQYGQRYYTRRTILDGDDRRGRLIARDSAGQVVGDYLYTTSTPRYRGDEYGYDSRGNLTSVTNAIGEAVAYGCDADGRIVSADGDTYPLSLSYDSDGSPVRLGTRRSDAVRDETTWRYDPASGRCLGKTYADGSSITSTWTADGLPLRTTRADGRWTESTYDANRRTCGIDSDDPDCTCALSRDVFGRVTSATNYVAAYAYELSRFGVATNETATVGTNVISIARGLDEYGRLATFWYTGGVVDSYLYSTNGVLMAISNDEVTVEYDYYKDRTLKGYRLLVAGGEEFRYSKYRTWYGDCAVTNVTTSVGSVTNGIVCGNDALYRMTSRGGDSFAYNSRGELASATVSNVSVRLEYDDIGNLTSAVLGSSTRSFCANQLNQYYGFSYSPDGELVGTGDLELTYDALSRLKSICSNEVTIAEYAYDHLGRRVMKRTIEADHVFFYDGLKPIVEIVSCADGTVDRIEYHWGLDVSETTDGAAGIGGLMYVKLNGVIYVPFADATGNIVEYRDANGDAVARYTYDPFGAMLFESGAMAESFRLRFSTRYCDGETGYCVYPGRYYDPKLRRWLTRDPAEEAGGMNLYAFCENAPTVKCDPLGRWAATAESKGKRRRVYQMEDGDTLADLAGKVGLDLSEITRWARIEQSKTADKTRSRRISSSVQSGCYVSVPNVWIAADLLRGGDRWLDPIINMGGTFGILFGTTFFTSTDYCIVKPKTARELYKAAANCKGDVWGLVVFAHGDENGNIGMPYENDFNKMNERSITQQNLMECLQSGGYRVAKAYLMQCYSLYSGLDCDGKNVDYQRGWADTAVYFYGYKGMNVMMVDTDVINAFRTGNNGKIKRRRKWAKHYLR